MPDFDEKNRLGDLYPTSYCGPREIMMALNEDGKSLKPEPILMTTGSLAVWERAPFCWGRKSELAGHHQHHGGSFAQK